MRKKIMLINRRPPHGSIYAFEALEIVLIASAFNQEISMAFIDDGVYQLMRNQNTQSIGTKNFSLSYRALADYDVHSLCVERESLAARGLATADLIVPVEVMSAAELSQRISQQDVVLSS